MNIIKNKATKALLSVSMATTLFFTANDNQYSKVCTATDEDIQAIYDDGVDAFFNIENLNQFNNN
jgi:hypothetical protein